MTERKLTDWLPTTNKEVESRGWDYLDVILFTGDAYVDHPSFGAAVIGRWLEHLGLRVAIVPQPNWRDDLRDFRKLGKPRLFFAVSAGAMDSMVNKYTAAKRLRSEDAYTPDARIDLRPEYPTVVYSSILKQLFPDIPVIAGGIEASMRRLAHYDYWQDKLLPSIAVTSKADILVYGCGEKPIAEIVQRLQGGAKAEDLGDIPQTVVVRKHYTVNEGDILLNPYEECLKNKASQAMNFKHIEEASNRINADRLIQETGNAYVLVNPPFPPMTTEELDATCDLPYIRLPHPRYREKRIPAYDMIRHSVTLHRGCFGGCAFCTISAHQGKFVVSRSKESILKEVHAVTEMPDFKGYISDLGGPSANMYGMKGKDRSLCEKCRKPSCIFPFACRNLNVDHRPLLEVYRAVDRIKGVLKSFVGSGVRYDLLVGRYGDEALNRAAEDYTRELITRHVSGRLKVAPEHSAPATLNCMRKPGFDAYYRFKRIFDAINLKHRLNQQLVPYFISSHPACTESDMADLAVITKALHFRPEQVQDFTPTPMTLSTEIFYTGIDPYTLKKVYTARTADEKQRQRQYFFWYDRKYKEAIIKSLHRLRRGDLVRKLFGVKN
ncbi:MAG: YgiQ family radical SAM protein [Dysgonamonadaceae bacterium]|jgi:uncharacterized radical SAM protein YgiQ|nr:YgiQ family radical SAM protein [Dysgonamonadaceae bacterium]